MKKYLTILMMLFIGGCGAIFNPHKSEFSCPDFDKGQCIKVEGAYKESLKKKKDTNLSEKQNKEACERCKKEAKANKVSEDTYCSACYSSSSVKESENNYVPDGLSETAYKKEVNKKLITMIKNPNTPLMVPPKVMRMLVLPYSGDQNELYMMRYIYLLIDDPKWVLGNYLIDAEE